MTVIDNQPSQLNAELFKEIENAQLSDINNVDINDVINKYIYEQISEQPTYVEQYKRYLKQRWDVYDIDFSQDYIDWHENMSQDGEGFVPGHRFRLPPRRAPGGSRTPGLHAGWQRGPEAVHLEPDRG